MSSISGINQCTLVLLIDQRDFQNKHFRRLSCPQATCKRNSLSIWCVLEQRFLCSPWCGLWWVSCAPGTHCSRGMSKGGWDPMGSWCWSRILARLVDLQVTHTKAVSSWRTAPHGRDSYWGSSQETAMGESPPWCRGGVWGVFPLGRMAQQRHVMMWPQPPFLIPLHCWGEEGKKLGVKLNPGRRKGWGKSVLRFKVISHYPVLIWLIIKIALISPSQIFFACSGNLSDLSLPCLDHELWWCFLFPVYLRRGAIERLCWTHGVQSGSVHHRTSDISFWLAK